MNPPYEKSNNSEAKKDLSLFPVYGSSISIKSHKPAPLASSLTAIPHTAKVKSWVIS